MLKLIFTKKFRHSLAVVLTLTMLLTACTATDKTKAQSSSLRNESGDSSSGALDGEQAVLPDNYKRLENGQLLQPYTKSYEHLDDCIAEIEGLATLLEPDGTELVVAPVPSKNSFYDIDYPEEREQNNPAFMEEIESRLDEIGVENINVNKVFKSRKMSMNEVYYKTDHHWTAEAAFVTVEEIVRKMGEMNSEYKYNADSFNKENWSTEVYEDWFLGTGGKKCGLENSEVDDLSYIHPKFDTRFCVDRINKDGTMSGNPRDSVYVMSQLEKADYTKNPYVLYLGGDYPLAYLRNEKAQNDKKVVVIGDSYRLPAECFLSTQFSELYHLDLRYYAFGTCAEFLKQVEPDAVILLFTNRTFGQNVQNFEAEKWETDFASRKSEELILSSHDLTLPKTDKNDDSQILLNSLQPGSYLMTLEDATLYNGSEISTSCMQMAVIDKKSGKKVAVRYLISDYGEQKWYFTVPQGTAKQYELVVYNGCPEITKDNRSQYEGITLKRLF